MTRMKVILVILACLIVVTLGFVQQYSIERLAYTMLIVVTMFYIFGSIMQYILNRIIKNNDPEEIQEQQVKSDVLPVVELNNTNKLEKPKNVISKSDEVSDNNAEINDEE